MPLDKKIFYSIIGLITIGCIFIWSSLSPYSSDNIIKKHYIQSAIAVLILLGGYTFNVYKIKKNVIFWYGVTCIVLLFVVLATPFGSTVNNSRRWLGLGSLRFQPSEFSKLAIIFISALYLTSTETDKSRRKLLLGMLGAIIFLTFIEPDIGQAALFSAAAFVVYMLYHHVKIKIVLTFAGTIILMLTTAFFAFDHVKNRLSSYASSLINPLESQYQVKQSIVGIASGSLLGKGIGNSVQKFSFLPESSNDFILAIILEESGVIGLLAILFLITTIISCSIKIAASCQDKFMQIVITGFTVIFMIQSFINIMVNTALLPPKGINLPFIGYGGSSMIVFASMFAVIISSHINDCPQTIQIPAEPIANPIPQEPSVQPLPKPIQQVQISPDQF
ncbi:MAG: FtsW/RodA/SpoVE family cell cycle protein [Planctomycetes bacterium]|nr:FtsW/RodA/SpoVE family cell cycle protein [Planctomycetota bacterium]